MLCNGHTISLQQCPLAYAVKHSTNTDGARVTSWFGHSGEFGACKSKIKLLSYRQKPRSEGNGILAKAV